MLHNGKWEWWLIQLYMFELETDSKEEEEQIIHDHLQVNVSEW